MKKLFYMPLINMKHIAIRKTDVIIINGQENPLYCTFSNNGGRYGRVRR